jgi:hypothetical protein
MPRGIGLFRRVVAGLLALALLVLPAGPPRHAVAAPGAQDRAHHVAHGDAAPPGQAALAAQRHDHQAADQGQPRDGRGGKPGLICCLVAQCPPMVAAPPPAAACLPASLGLPLRLAIESVQFTGIDVAPALPPPREAP